MRQLNSRFSSPELLSVMNEVVGLSVCPLNHFVSQQGLAVGLFVCSQNLADTYPYLLTFKSEEKKLKSNKN